MRTFIVLTLLIALCQLPCFAQGARMQFHSLNDFKNYLIRLGIPVTSIQITSDVPSPQTVQIQYDPSATPSQINQGNAALQSYNWSMPDVKAFEQMLFINPGDPTASPPVPPDPTQPNPSISAQARLELPKLFPVLEANIGVNDEFIQAYWGEMKAKANTLYPWLDSSTISEVEKQGNNFGVILVPPVQLKNPMRWSGLGLPVPLPSNVKFINEKKPKNKPKDKI